MYARAAQTRRSGGVGAPHVASFDRGARAAGRCGMLDVGIARPSRSG